MKEEIKTIEVYTLELDKDSVSIKFDKKENKTLSELNQAVINYLYKKINDNKLLSDSDIELLKIVNKKIRYCEYLILKELYKVTAITEIKKV